MFDVEEDEVENVDSDGNGDSDGEESRGCWCQRRESRVIDVNRKISRRGQCIAEWL